MTLSTSQNVSGALLEPSGDFVKLYNKSPTLTSLRLYLGPVRHRPGFSFTSDQIMIEFDPWSICRMTDCGHLVVLAGFDTYAKADEVSDDYAEQYPNGLVDIYSRGFLLNCEVDQ